MPNDDTKLADGLARQAHHTPEHWWPLLVAVGAAGEGWQAEPVGPGGMRYGTLSMVNVHLRRPAA